MCGLFGSMSGFLTKEEINKTLLLGFLSSTRGMDSTGLCLGFKSENAKTKATKPFVFDGHKDTTDAVEFLNDERVQDLVNSKLDKVLMLGHCRYATIGDKNVRNAHPHMFKHIIGAHNGTVRSFNTKDEDKKLGSDSRVLFKKLADQGLVPTLKDASWGAYALTYVDKSNNTLNFVRNNDRPLWFMKLVGGGTIWWASEKRMLAYMANGDSRYGEPFELPVDTLYSFEIGVPREHEEKKLVLRETYTYHHGHNTPYTHGRLSKKERKKLQKHWPIHTQNGRIGDINETARPPLGLPAPRQSVSEMSRIAEQIRNLNSEMETQAQLELRRAEGPFIEKYKDYMYKGYQNDFMTPQEASHKLDQGCNTCINVCDMEDEVFWISNTEYVCEHCAEQEWVSQFFDPKDAGELVHIKTI